MSTGVDKQTMYSPHGAMMPSMPYVQAKIPSTNPVPISDPIQRMNEQFVQRIDAGSRIILEAINLSDKSRIAQMGDFTHNTNSEGFYSWDGKKIALPTASQLTKLTSEFLSQPPELYGPNTVEVFTKQFLAALGPDPVYLARSLKLDKRNYDNLRHGKIIRSFTDNITPMAYTYIPLPIFDHLNVFLRMDVLYYGAGAVFTRKCFKFTDRPGELTLLFKPEHPGVCWGICPEYRNDMVLTTDAMEFINFPQFYAWLNNSGDLEELDWEIFRGRRVSYLWHADGFQAKNQFSAAIHFAATARKHGIEAQIVKHHTETMLGDYVLTIPELIKQAYAYGLSIPSEFRNKKHVFTEDNIIEFVPVGIPHFWQNGRSTLFCGRGQKVLLFNLYQAFFLGYYGFWRRNIAIIFPENAEMRTCKLSRNLFGSHSPLLINSGILQNADELEKTVYQSGIEVIFIIFAEDFSHKELTALWERCEKMRLTIGIFTKEEDCPESVDEILVDQRFLTIDADQTVFAKDMKTQSIGKYSFKYYETLSASTGSEEEFLKEKEKKYENFD